MEGSRQDKKQKPGINHQDDLTPPTIKYLKKYAECIKALFLKRYAINAGNSS